MEIGFAIFGAIVIGFLLGAFASFVFLSKKIAEAGGLVEKQKELLDTLQAQVVRSATQTQEVLELNDRIMADYQKTVIGERTKQ